MTNDKASDAIGIQIDKHITESSPNGWGEGITLRYSEPIAFHATPEEIVQAAPMVAVWRTLNGENCTAEDVVREAGLDPADWQHILNPPPPPPIPIHARAKRAVRRWLADTRLKVGSWIAGMDFGEEDW